jgi:hypothetical protein
MRAKGRYAESGGGGEIGAVKSLIGGVARVGSVGA